MRQQIFTFDLQISKIMHRKRDSQRRFGIIISLITILFAYNFVLAEDIPKIFPVPKEAKYSEGEFILDETTEILIPENAGENDWFLARLLVAELGDLYLLPVKIIQSNTIPSDKNIILMGSISNNLVKDYCSREQMMEELKSLGDEGYILKVMENRIIVASKSSAGSLYGFESLRQLITSDSEKMTIPNVKVIDSPALPFRGIRLFIPGRENLTFFKRFIKDFMALYKFNKVILEVNGAMRLDKHPEINVGSIEFAQDMIYTRRDRPEGPGNQYQNSAHHDAGDGEILEKEEVAELVDYIRKFHIEVIPEITSLMHSYYLLNRHRELAEIKDAEWPDTYCPSNPESYKLVFDVLDEYIDVIKPQMIHLGKDEWRMPVEVCALCKGKDYRELFVQDIQKIYEYLKDREIKVALWGDHLLESVRQKGFRDRETKSGYKYKIPGALTPKQVHDSIPKDILVFNWFWGDKNNDLAVEKFGFKQVYGNFRPNISEWNKRSKWPSVVGGAPSSWAGTTEFNFGKDLLSDFLGCGNLLWSERALTQAEMLSTTRHLIPKIRRYLMGNSLPSADNNDIVSLDLSSHYNASTQMDILGITLKNLKSGQVGSKNFTISKPEQTKGEIAIVVGTDEGKKSTLPTKETDIKINNDVSSLIFLHACARQAGNDKAYRQIHDFNDTADLLGWYEVVYEDGYITTIPIRYGVNILDINAIARDKDGWVEGKTGAPQNVYAYQTEFLECSTNPDDPKAFFAYEWKNPRMGKSIEYISIHGSKSFRNSSNKVIPENAILLLAINYTKKRPIPDVKLNSSEIKK